MIIDQTQDKLLKQMELRTFFSNPINAAKALVLARSILPGWYYEEIKKELMSTVPTGLFGHSFQSLRLRKCFF